jgi:hypothetical protein
MLPPWQGAADAIQSTRTTQVHHAAGRRGSLVAAGRAQVKEKPGRRSLSKIKLMKSDPVAMEAQRDEIKARYARLFGG